MTDKQKNIENIENMEFVTPPDWYLSTPVKKGKVIVTAAASCLYDAHDAEQSANNSIKKLMKEKGKTPKDYDIVKKDIKILILTEWEKEEENGKIEEEECEVACFIVFMMAEA